MKRMQALAAVFVLSVMFCLGTGAFEMETVETLTEAVSSADGKQKVALAGEIDITDSAVLNNSAYGTLIYYNDFDGYELDTTGTISGDETYVGELFEGNTLNIQPFNSTLQIAADPKNSGNQALMVTTRGAYANANFKPQKHVTALGTYTIVMDFYVPSENKSATIWGLVYLNDNGGSHAAISFGDNVLDGWAVDRAMGSFRVVGSEKFSTNPSDKKGKCFDNVYLSDRRGTVTVGTYYYIDNLRIYYQPGVNVTYDCNLPEGVTTVYNVKASANPWVAFTTAEEFVTVGTAVPELYAPGYTFLGWTDENGTYVDVFSADTAKLTAQWTPVKPGLNALTGTYEKASFEKGNRQYLIFEDGSFTRQITENDIKTTVSGNDSARVLKTSSNARRYVVYDFPVAPENGRKYCVTWDTYTDVGFSGLMGWFLHYYGQDKHISLNLQPQKNANIAQKWYTNVIDTNAAGASNRIAMQYKYADDNALSGPLNVYFDNLAVYPYYKITYHFSDGSTVVDQALVPGKADQTYAVSSSEYDVWTGEGNKICIGWATTPNAVTAQASVPLANADIDLYPVFQDVPETQYLATNFVNAAKPAGYYHIAVSKPFTKVTADVGLTGAEVSTYHNSTLRIKSNDYAGDITVTFTLADGSTKTETVHLIGGTKWRPGLNTLTGTAKPFDFEGMTDAEAEYAIYTSGNRWKMDVNPVTGGINTGKTAIYSTAQYAIMSAKNNWSPAIEKERPISYEFDILSSNVVYTMVNGSGGGTSGNIYKEHYGSGAKTAWKHEVLKIDLINGNPVSNKGFPLPNAKDGVNYLGTSGKTGNYGKYANGAVESGKNAYLYMDNISYIPYYKITYVLADGSTVNDYALYDEKGVLLTAYTPKADLLGSKRYKLSESGEALDVTTPIPLANADITLYAVTENYAANTENVFSFRKPTDTVSAGIRFKANVSPLTRYDADEIGFIVARADKLGEKELKFNSDLSQTTYKNDNKNFSGKTDDGVTYSGAVNYSPTKSIDIQYGIDSETNHYEYTCILVNLNKGYTEGGTTHENRYDVAFTVRPYVMIAGNVYYGESTTKSYNEITANQE